MDPNIVMGVGLGFILVLFLAAALTDVVSEAVRVPGRLFRAVVSGKKQLFRAISRHLASTAR